ncbi:hypothetical protein B488_09520 [Liberibacter crescens BT-1]|uniref:Uncharacterized protein n=1 Tax=Liberibacter crescens (strain BT-1) TaxID=1215343 RepID=L0ETS6_LIBCB|nr:hypothetical protein [Liberibacter crescens]AGA64944.1 hypothetical protein B488_09520 [Liberibacter crescens BT-1]AMC12965.1 hypothetical protein RL73_04795 [Liberibacter crescens]
MLSRYLKDFSQVNMPVVDTSNVSEQCCSDMIPVLSFSEVKAEKEKAYAEGYAQASRELKEYWESKNADIQKMHLNEISCLRELLERRAGEKISVGLKEIIQSLRDFLETKVFKALVPVLEEGLARKAAFEMAEFVLETLKHGECGAIIIHGSEKTYSIIERELEEYSNMVRHIVSDSDQVSLSVEISGHVIVSRIDSWAAEIKKILA